MNNKKLLTWIGIFVLVALVVTLAGILRNKRPNEKSLLFFPGLDETQIGSVLIVSKGDSVTIKRTGDVFVVAGIEEQATGGMAALGTGDSAAASPAELSPLDRDYPVDSASLASALEKITVMKKDELVSTNPEKQAMFEVNTDKGVYVEVTDVSGKRRGAIYVGKNAAGGWSSNYVRQDGSDDVYMVTGSVKHAFTTDKKRWRDKTITRFSKATATSLRLAKKDGTVITLSKTTDSTGTPIWNMTAPDQARADQGKVDEVVNTMATLNTTEWETDATLTDSAMGFAEPELRATVTLEGGVEHTVIVGTKEEKGDKFWVRTPAREGITFRVGNYNIDKLDKGIDELKATEEPATEEASS